MMKDISLEEEANLPLPKDWIRTMRMSLNDSGADNLPSETIYKNLTSGLESEEHPFLLKAMNIARKRDLPVGWTVKQVTHTDGSEDYFYFHAEDGISMWDPPLLRECLSECLLSEGYNPIELGILSEKDVNMFYPIEDCDESKDKIDHDFKNFTPHANFDPEEFESSQYDDSSLMLDNEDEDFPKRFSHLKVKHAPVVAQPSQDKFKLTASDISKFVLSFQATESQHKLIESSTVLKDFHGDNHDINIPTFGGSIKYDSSSERNEVRAILDPESDDRSDNNDVKIRDWTTFLSRQQDDRLNDDRVYDMVNRISTEHLPMSITGIEVLKNEVVDTTDRIHQLIIKLRALLALKRGIESSVYMIQGGSHTSKSNKPKNLITLGSDIVSTLRQNPRFVISALARTNIPNNSVTSYIAFTALHRLCHPLSTDNSMTVALLLQGFNHQLDEIAALEQSFSKFDPKVVVKALFISDPETAINWNPLNCPMPLIPLTDSDTVLSCLLKTYAIRRDVTMYYRLVWKPLLPAILAVLNTDDSKNMHKNNQNGPHVFANIVTIADKLMDCTLKEKSAQNFPPIAIKLSQTVFEIGGTEALCNYLLNFLILPNLLKVLAGDHDSTENEDVYRLENISIVVDKYFDHKFWCEMPSYTTYHRKSKISKETKSNEKIFAPFPSLIWVIWRLYTCATNVQEISLVTMTTKSFVGSRFKYRNGSLDLSGVVDQKIRSIVARWHRKIARFCDIILSVQLSPQEKAVPDHNAQHKSVNSSLLSRKRIQHQQHQQLEGEDSNSVQSEVSSVHSLIQVFQNKAALSLAADFKPSEMLNATIVSRYELGNLFTDIGLAIEADHSNDDVLNNDDPLATSLYRAISEYLVLDESDRGPEHEDRREQLMQLQFLYNSNAPVSSTPIDDNDDTIAEETFESEAHLIQRHDQLLRGLKLSHKYEDSLLKTIFKVENNETNDLYDLVCNESWHQLPAFDAKFKQESINTIRKAVVATKHTAASSQRVKHSKFGLQEPKEVEPFPMFSCFAKHDLHPNFRSLKEIQKDVLDSYRFGSSSSCMGVGTSIARSITIQPKINPSSVNVTNISSLQKLKHKDKEKSHSNSSRMKYTLFDEAVLKSNILTPTESVRNHNNPSESTSKEMDKKFINALRFHESKEFHNDELTSKRRRRHRNVQQVQELQLQQSLQPFPEHLRHRIRDDNNYNNESNYEEYYPQSNSDFYDNGDNNNRYNYGENFNGAAVANGRMRDDGDDCGDNVSKKVRRLSHNTEEQPSMDDSDFIASIINDYKKLRMHDNNYDSSSENKNVYHDAEDLPPPPPTTFNGHYSRYVDVSNISDVTGSPHYLATAPYEDLPPSNRVPLSPVKFKSEDDEACLTNNSINNGTVINIQSSLGSESKAQHIIVPLPPSLNTSTTLPAKTAKMSSISSENHKDQPTTSSASQPPISSTSSSYSLVFDGLRATTAVQQDHCITDLRADRARALQDREQKLLQPPTAEPECYGDVIPALTFGNKKTIQLGQGVETSNSTTTQNKTPPKLILKKSAVLSKNELVGILYKGFIAIKHGRSGGPKKRFIIFNESNHTLEWRPVASNSLFSSSQPATPAKLSRTVSGMFRRSASTNSATLGGTAGEEENGERSILIDDLVEVRRGVFTDVLRRAGLIDPTCCVSLITNSRSLDLVLPSCTERDGFVRGLKALLEESSRRAAVKFF